jgi:hypothetical protein
MAHAEVVNVQDGSAADAAPLLRSSDVVGRPVTLRTLRHLRASPDRCQADD